MTRIGVDFDNTIVCYDQLFYRAAVERRLIPPEVPESKEGVRDYLRHHGMEDRWTELQGYVYGVYIGDAPPFEGVREFFLRARRADDCQLYIISHKTHRPFRGPDVDLHAAARGWLRQHGFHDPAGIALPPQRTFFEETKEAKIDRIAELGCQVFIDDLPEFLAEPNFPAGARRILFDPNATGGDVDGVTRAASWDQIAKRCLGRPL